MPPTEKLTLSIFPTPAGRVKSGLIRCFGLVPQWVRTLSTHAIASQAQSHRLNLAKTRNRGAIGRGLAISACRNAKGGDSEAPFLRRRAYTETRFARFRSFKKEALPLTAICHANFAYPHRTKVFSSPSYAYRVPIIKPPFRRLALPILAYPPFLFETGFLRERSRGFLSTQKKAAVLRSPCNYEN